MDNKVEVAHRLIERERALRLAGSLPTPQSVEKCIEFVTQHKLLGDAAIRDYLVSTAETYPNDYYVAIKLLGTVLALVEQGFSGEALAILKKMIHFEDASVWYSQKTWGAHHLAEVGFKTILGNERLLVDHVDSWGAMAISLFGRLLLEHQQQEWPKLMARRHGIAKALREDSEAEEPFSPDYDDPFSAHPSTREMDHRKPHWLLGSVLEGALKRALLEPKSTSFAGLADQLIALQWAGAIAMPLEVLYGSLSSSKDPTPWHLEEAARLLTLSAVGKCKSVSRWRRFLRSSLPETTPEEVRRRIVEAIRRQEAQEETVILSELGDVRSWNVLTEEELRKVEAAEKAGEIWPLKRAQDQPNDFKPVRLSSGPNYVVDGWSKPEQRPLLKLLYDSTPISNQSASREDQWKSVRPKLEALRALIAEPQAKEEPWKSHFVCWAEQALTEVKRVLVLEQGRDPTKEGLGLEEYVSSLGVHTPWWEEVAKWALEGIQGPVPGIHRDNQTAGLSWGTADPIFSSLAYLDELLAVERGEPFDTYRQKLGDAFTNAWPGWPGYTRVIALVSLRPYHWHTIEKLSVPIDEMWKAETDPNILEECLQLILSRPEVANRLRDLIPRIQTMESAGQLANRVGNVLGDAVIRSRGEREPYHELELLAVLCDATLESLARGGQYNRDFINGILWGAFECIRSLSELGESHAECWAPIAKRGIELALENKTEEGRLEGIMQGVTAVLECRWPASFRAKLYAELADVFVLFLQRASLGDFVWFHFLLGKELKGDIEANATPAGAAPRTKQTVAPNDEMLVRLCRASAERVRQWVKDGTSTSDIGWGGALSGRDTADLIRAVYLRGKDRGFLQRSLPPAIDLLGEAGLTELATDLRLLLRRG